jgi:hypothetical protein
VARGDALMAASLLGADQLLTLLDDPSRVVISNRSSERSAIVVVSVAVALHGDDGSRRVRTAHGLGLRAGESRALDDSPPASTPVVAAEALMRLLDDDAHRMIEAYATVEGTAEEPLGALEFGIVETDGDDATGTTPLADAPQFAVFVRSES